MSPLGQRVRQIAGLGRGRAGKLAACRYGAETDCSATSMTCSRTSSALPSTRAWRS